MITLTQAEIRAASELLYELSISRLEVCLIPAPNPKHAGHMVRSVVNENPAWYRRLANRSVRKRRHNRINQRHDTNLRRQWVERSLTRLITNGVAATTYDHMLLPIVRQFTETPTKQKDAQP